MSVLPEHLQSPCVKVCALDPDTGLCGGCYRTIDEIADWIEMTPEQQRATLNRAARRQAQFESD